MIKKFNLWFLKFDSLGKEKGMKLSISNLRKIGEIEVEWRDCFRGVFIFDGVVWI